MKRLIGVTALLGAALMLAGCGDDDDDSPDSQVGEVRVIHASPDAPPVNVIVSDAGLNSRTDGESPLDNLDFAESTGYLELDAATYDVSVEAIVPGGNLEVISVPGLELGDGDRVTVVAIDNASNIRALPVSDSASEPGSDEVAVAVAHAAPNAALVDVYVVAPGTSPGDTSAAFSFNFGEVVDAGNLPAGLVEILVTAPGGDEALYNSGPVDLTSFAGQKLLIVALSTTTNVGMQAAPVKLLVATDSASLVLTDADTGTGLRVVHLSPDAATAAGGAVEVWATSDALGGSVEVIDAFNYHDVVPGADSFVSVPAGDYVFDVAPDTDTIGDSVYTSPQLMLGTGEERSVIAAGRVLSDPAFGLLVVDEWNRSIVTQASVKVVHAAPAAGLVHVYVTPAGDFSVADVEAGMAGDPLLANFPFGDITDYVSVTPGDVDIRVVPVASGMVAINAEGVGLTGGLVATVIARGPDESDGDPADFGLMLLTN